MQNRPLAADGADAVFIRATICDANGNPVLNATNVVSFAMQGNAQFISPTRVHAEAGIATALIRSSSFTPGKILLHATAFGLESAETKLKLAPAK